MAVKDDPRFDPEPRTYKTTEQMPHGAAPLTVTEAMQWCLDKGLSPDEVKLTGGHFVWDRTETPEEVERRLTYARATRERHEQWIRDQFAKLDADIEKRLEEKQRERDA